MDKGVIISTFNFYVKPTVDHRKNAILVIMINDIKKSKNSRVLIGEYS